MAIIDFTNFRTFRTGTSTLEKSVIANSILFIRSGVWVWYILVDFFVLENEIVLKKYITIGHYFPGYLFLFLLFKVSEIKFKNYSLPDWKWIGAGFKTSSVFFCWFFVVFSNSVFGSIYD